MCVSSLKQLPLRRPVFPGLTRELPRADLSAEAFTTRMISAKKQLSQVVPVLELHHHRLWDGAHLCGRLHHTASGLLDRSRFGVGVPKNLPAFSPEEAVEKANEMPGDEVVVPRRCFVPNTRCICDSGDARPDVARNRGEALKCLKGAGC